MAARRLTEADIERAIVMRERQGMSLDSIGAIIGCSGKALSWHFLQRAVNKPKPAPLRLDYHLECPVLKRGNHLVRAFTPEEDARLLALEAQGLTHTEIGRALGRKPNSVKGRLMTLARRDERAEAA